MQVMLKTGKVTEFNLDSTEFVETLDSGFPGLKAELDLVYSDVMLDTKDVRHVSVCIRNN